MSFSRNGSTSGDGRSTGTRSLRSHTCAITDATEGHVEGGSSFGFRSKREILQAIRIGAPVIRMGTVTSTMDVARSLERFDAAEGTVIVAAHQTHGRGRAGRSWDSPRSSGLYCSILLRPRIPVSAFQPASIAVGLALCEALDPDNRFGLTLKWPNDILLGDRKLAGILITTNLTGETVESAIIGIGLNLTSDSDRPARAVSLEEIREIDPWTTKDLLQAIFESIQVRYLALLAGDPDRVLMGWSDHLAYQGDLVTLCDGNTQRSGRLIGIDSTGALRLETDTGPVSIATGDLQRGPRLQSNAS